MKKPKSSLSAPCAIILGAVMFSAAATAAPIRIRTGANNTVTGYLDTAPDEYGAWAEPFNYAEGPNDDHFKPAGHVLRHVTFTSGFFLFTENSERELLTDNTAWQAVTDGMGGAPFSADTSLSRSVTSANVASDSSGDGVNDTLSSAFRVFNASQTVDLAFTLVQNVRSVSAGVAALQQTYTVRNNATTAINFTMARSFDADLLFTSGSTTTDPQNDQVGTGAHAAGLGQFVYIRERNDNSTAVTLSGGTRGRYYYGGVHSVTPPNGPPPFEYGTDTEVWDGFGVPTSWQNYVATVGYNTDGASGTVAGSLDAFIGLDFAFSLIPALSTTFDVFYTYGQNTPAPARCPADLDHNGSVALGDLTILLAHFGGAGTPATGDLNNDGVVGLADLTIFLSSFGIICP